MQWRYIGIFDAFFDAKQRGLWMRLQSPLHYTLFSFLVWFNCTYGNTFTRLETSLYRFNTSSGGRVVIFLKTDRDSEAIVRYCTYIDW